MPRAAFFCSGYDEAAVLTIDGVGEWATAASGLGRGKRIELDRELRWPHSLGMLYSTFTAFLGFEVNEGEYKVMGMAPYGTPRYADRVREVVRVADDGALELNLDYFAFHRSHTRSFSDKFVKLFGPSRDPASKFFTRSSGYPSYFGPQPANHDALAERNEFYADVAASVQQVTEEVMVRMARGVLKRTGQRRLCMAGGVALNCVANGRILREVDLDGLYVQPSAGDGGGAVGAALFAWHTLLDNPRSFAMTHGYWGEEYGDEEAATAARAAGFTPSDWVRKPNSSRVRWTIFSPAA